ncbi:MAG: undecaprenyl/decaprenyl-phosphate alpha-N-acetylglucosaminyl 1-phosphate transferase [Actinobacteria bacterium]|nr:undecaprenyl/decaprenyl-phosphate alpha-N-acetylglucosaminyl 1-phosphate transferase [Actinomycetota bacterium]
MTGVELTVAYVLAFLTPLLATSLLTPAASWVAHRFGMLDHPSEDRHHANATPYLGGIAVAIGLALVASFSASASGQLLTILGGGIALMLVGLVDDRRGVGPITKVLVQVAAACALWLAGVRAGMFGVEILDLALTIFWVVAITNAVNLLDNMDGLAAGVAAIASLTYFAIAASQGDYLVGSFALGLAGASVGFLRHNFPPARIFLGDAGSLMLGFLLAALALKLDLVGASGVVRTAVPVLILGVPVFDTILVIISRSRAGTPIYQGGTDHSSHRLTDIGFTARGVALATYAAQATACATALFIVEAGDTAALIALCLSVVVGGVGLFLFLTVHRTAPVVTEDPVDTPE